MHYFPRLTKVQLQTRGASAESRKILNTVDPKTLSRYTKEFHDYRAALIDHLVNARPTPTIRFVPAGDRVAEVTEPVFHLYSHSLIRLISEAAHDEVSMIYGNGYRALCDHIELLCALVQAYTGAESLWDGDDDLGSLLVACYWFFTDHVDGQASDEYRLSCIIGRIYSPGMMTSGPEEGSSEQDLYAMISDCYNKEVRSA